MQVVLNPLQKKYGEEEQNFQPIPSDLYALFCSYLSLRDASSFMQTCKTIRDAVQNEPWVWSVIGSRTYPRACSEQGITYDSLRDLHTNTCHLSDYFQQSHWHPIKLEWLKDKVDTFCVHGREFFCLRQGASEIEAWDLVSQTQLSSISIREMNLAWYRALSVQEHFLCCHAHGPNGGRLVLIDLQDRTITYPNFKNTFSCFQIFENTLYNYVRDGFHNTIEVWDLTTNCKTRALCLDHKIEKFVIDRVQRRLYCVHIAGTNPAILSLDLEGVELKRWQSVKSVAIAIKELHIFESTLYIDCYANNSDKNKILLDLNSFQETTFFQRSARIYDVIYARESPRIYYLDLQSSREFCVYDLKVCKESRIDIEAGLSDLQIDGSECFMRDGNGAIYHNNFLV